MNKIKRLENNIKYISLYFFFRSFIFAYVIERLFWRSRGISISETVYLEFVYAVVIIALEIPTGLWADCWQRKSLISGGAVLAFIGSIIMVYVQGFWMFALVITLSGIQRRFWYRTFSWDSQSAPGV